MKQRNIRMRKGSGRRRWTWRLLDSSGVKGALPFVGPSNQISRIKGVHNALWRMLGTGGKRVSFTEDSKH